MLLPTALSLTASLLLAVVPAVVAGDSNSTSSQCDDLEYLTWVVDTANNETALDEATDGDSTAIAEFQTAADKAQDELSDLQSNTTLVEECSQRSAVNDMRSDCVRINTLESIVEANSTRVSDDDLNEVKSELATFNSNDTLLQFCANQATMSDCNYMAQLNVYIDSATNDTFLDDRFGDNTSARDLFTSDLDNARNELSDLSSNSTLLDACDDNGIDVSGAATNGTDNDAVAAEDSESGTQRSNAAVSGSLFAAALAAGFVALGF